MAVSRLRHQVVQRRQAVRSISNRADRQGDEISNANQETQIGTTFLRLGPYDSIANNKDIAKYNQLDDILGTTSLAFMGQTIQCARCHDHKFEPITQEDYFSMLGAFESLSIGSGERTIGSIKAWVFSDRGKPKPTKLHVRGDVMVRGREVAFGLPVVFDTDGLSPPVAQKNSSGRRLWLAQYMTGQGSHLTARVMANRVWHYHFGKGFLENPSNFGSNGGKPTHPKLLDYLAYELRDGGWKLKRLHKMIVLSNTYRQSASHPKPQADIENKLFSRWPLHRLQAEVIRDSMLSVSGKLNLKMAGESVHPAFENQIAGDSSRNTWKKSPEEEASRRSVYVYAKRAIPFPDLALLDAPESTESCGLRKTSTTAVQSLLLMNGKSAFKNAEYLAERVKREAKDDFTSQIKSAFKLVLCREPNASELKLSLAFLDPQPSGGEESEPAPAQHFISDVVEKSNHIVDVKLDIRGAKSLFLVVTDGGNGNGGDWANWIDPKLDGPEGPVKLTELAWITAESGWQEARVGKAVGGSPMTVKGKVYAEGIGTHANSVIEYSLPPGFTTFTAQGANDDRGQGRIQFMVFTSQADLEKNLSVKPSDQKKDASKSQDPLTAFCLMLLNTNEFVYAN